MGAFVIQGRVIECIDFLIGLIETLTSFLPKIAFLGFTFVYYKISGGFSVLRFSINHVLRKVWGETSQYFFFQESRIF